MKRLLISLMLLSLVLLFGGCSSSGGGDGPPVKTATQLTTEGWQYYAAKNYTTALARFTEATKVDGGFVDALNGEGWAKAKLNAMASAETSFTTGLTKDPVNLQIKAGLAFVMSARKQYTLSIQRAGEVLAADSSWSFSRDLSIGASDLHLLLAENYFAQGDFAASLAEIRLLNSSFNVDVGTALGRAALSAEIEQLRTIV